MYSPDNAASPVYGLVLPFRRIQLKMTYSGTSYLFSGYLQDILPDASKHVDVGTAQLTAFGIITRLQDATANVALQEDITTGEAIMAALNAAGVSSERITIIKKYPSLLRGFCGRIRF